MTRVEAAVALCMLAAGCGAADFAPTSSRVSPAVIRHFRGLPPGVDLTASQLSAHLRNARRVTPLVMHAGSRSIYLTTWASGGCPEVPTTVRAQGPRHVIIRTVIHDFESGDNACSADLAPTTSLLRLPWRIATDKPFTVRVDGVRVPLTKN
jgi:hypothetical protein